MSTGTAKWQLLLLLLACLLVLSCAGATEEDDPALREFQQQQQLKFEQATQLRNKPGASARDQKHAIELLKFAGGLVQHSWWQGSSSQHAAGSGGTGGEQQVLPVPGFPDLAFNSTGRADALRELALAFQRGVGVEVNHQLSLELFRRAADLGDPAAQGMMGMRAAVGLSHLGSFEGASIRQFGVPDEAAAVLHYYFGAANGDMFASAALGYRHAYGLGVPRSCWSAVSYYKPVAEAVVQEAVEAAQAAGPLGSSSGRGLPQIERIRLNVHANQGIKPDRQREVLQYYQYSADRGNVEAQTAVGTLLNIGTHGVVRDHVQAAHYLQRAAAGGNAEAVAHLGHMYGSGLGVPQDYEQALKYFRRAADKNNGLGLYGLGYMYLSGTAVPQDYDTAFKKLQEAADAGDRDAHFYLGAMYYNGLGMRRKSLSKAFVHFFQAASAGHVQAQYNVAMMHLAGKGTPRSCKPALTNLKALVEKGPQAAALQAGHEAFFRGHHNQALLLYLQAAELGMEVAQSNAAWMLQRGFGHSGPLAAAVATLMYRRSAEQGNVVSLLQLGDCYYYGGGVEQDWVRSAAIYYEAYKLGSPEAMFNLGYMHEFGAGVPKDLALALRFYNMAKHTNADAALPVYLARSWLSLHKAWDKLRPVLPRAVVSALGWLFEVRPAITPAAGGFWSSAPSSSSGSDVQQLTAAASTAAAAPGGLLPPGSDTVAPGGGGGSSTGSSTAGGASFQQQQQQGRVGGGGSAGPWWLALSPAALAWRWDSVVWKMTEAAGLAGLSFNSFLEEYSDLGETLLLFVLLAVLLLVLHIRRQRQQALQARLMAALAQPDQAQQLMAQQIATQLGLALPQAQEHVGAAAAAAGGAAAGGVGAAAAGGGGGVGGVAGQGVAAAGQAAGQQDVGGAGAAGASSSTPAAATAAAAGAQLARGNVGGEGGSGGSGGLPPLLAAPEAEAAAAAEAASGPQPSSVQQQQQQQEAASASSSGVHRDPSE